MMISLAVWVVPVALGRMGVTSVDAFVEFVTAIEFDEAVLHSMLGALLLAGALHVNLDDLAPQKGVIALLAALGIAISTLVVGGLTCLLFGAIGPPTDSIPVGAILKSVGVPDTLLTKITGESLFNDGVGVVVFLLLLELAVGAGDVQLLGGNPGAAGHRHGRVRLRQLAPPVRATGHARGRAAPGKPRPAPGHAVW